MNKLKLILQAIEDDGYHIFIDVLVNEKPARILVDTGASRTVFDVVRIKKFLDDEEPKFEKNEKLSTGLGTNSMESHTVIISRLELGNTVLAGYNAVVLNIDHVNQSYSQLGFPEIDGVLGGDLLSELKAVIDYRKKEIRWRS